MRERDVENYLKRNIERLGGECLKFVSPGKSGVPDRLCLMAGGNHFFVEVKAKGQKLKPLQEKIQKTFWAIGHPVYVVDTKEAVDLLIAKIVIGSGNDGN